MKALSVWSCTTVWLINGSLQQQMRNLFVCVHLSQGEKKFPVTVAVQAILISTSKHCRSVWMRACVYNEKALYCGRRYGILRKAVESNGKPVSRVLLTFMFFPAKSIVQIKNNSHFSWDLCLCRAFCVVNLTSSWFSHKILAVSSKHW